MGATIPCLGLSSETQHTVSTFFSHCTISSPILNGDFEPQQMEEKREETNAFEENRQTIGESVALPVVTW